MTEAIDNNESSVFIRTFRKLNLRISLLLATKSSKSTYLTESAQLEGTLSERLMTEPFDLHGSSAQKERRVFGSQCHVKDVKNWLECKVCESRYPETQLVLLQRSFDIEGPEPFVSSGVF